MVIGEPIAESQATLIEREPRPDREQTAEVAAMKRVFTERLRGVVLARQYLMMEYDCPKTVKDAAVKITPGCRRRRSRRWTTTTGWPCGRWSGGRRRTR